MSAEKLRAAIGEDNWSAFSGTGPNLREDDMNDHMRGVLMKAIQDKVIIGMESVESGPWDAVWTALKKVSDVAMHGSMATCDMAAIEI